jgi:hypothetical protein
MGEFVNPFGSVLDVLHADANSRPDAGVGPEELPPGGLDWSAGAEGGMLEDPAMRAMTEMVVATVVGVIVGQGIAAGLAPRTGVPANSVGAMQRLRFQASPKHPVRVSPRPGVSPGPVHGQEALDTSVGIGETTSRRVGIDYARGDYVVFDEHLPGAFHGHIRPWGGLSQQMQNALTRAEMANRKGKILTD